jgi:glycerophosphoryl diester phosphodiesterase
VLLPICFPLPAIIVKERRPVQSRPVGNPKSEGREPKEIRNPKSESTPSLSALRVPDTEKAAIDTKPSACLITERRVQNARIIVEKGASNLSAQQVIATPGPFLIAHRGYSQLAPENTLPAFELALAAGARFVEMDCREARDGVPMVIHDAELDRTTDARKRWKKRRIRVESRTLAEIRTLDAGSWFGPSYAGARIPLLSEALDVICPSAIALIERKSGSAENCIKLLREKGWADRTLILAFDWNYLCEFHEQAPKQMLAALGPPHRLPNGRRPLRISRTLNRRWVTYAQKTGARVIVWNRHVSKAAIQFAHERGFKVLIYTVDNMRLAKELLAKGVDGLITNDVRNLTLSLEPSVQCAGPSTGEARPGTARRS